MRDFTDMCCIMEHGHITPITQMEAKFSEYCLKHDTQMDGELYEKYMTELSARLAPSGMVRVGNRHDAG